MWCHSATMFINVLLEQPQHVEPACGHLLPSVMMGDRVWLTVGAPVKVLEASRVLPHQTGKNLFLCGAGFVHEGVSCWINMELYLYWTFWNEWTEEKGSCHICCSSCSPPWSRDPGGDVIAAASHSRDCPPASNTQYQLHKRHPRFSNWQTKARPVAAVSACFAWQTFSRATALSPGASLDAQSV